MKKDVAEGTLDARLVQERKLPQSITQKHDDASKGLRMQRYRTAASALQQASQRLSKDSTDQSQYWQQLAELKATNWPISRLPSDTHALAVHFGSMEASPMFRNLR